MKRRPRTRRRAHERARGLLCLVAASVILAGSGCDFLTGGGKRMIGIIGATDHVIELPDTVQVGQPFPVSVRSGWPNGCARMDGMDVSIDGSAARVTPFIFVTESRGTVCVQDPQFFLHTALITFGEVGPARIVVRGRASRSSSDLIEIQRDVFVR